MTQLRSCAIALTMCVALLGCSRPQNTVIPADPKQWNQISEQVQKLSPEDRRLLAAYLMRASLAATFTHNAVAVPTGTTIGDAINQQRDIEAKNSTDAARSTALREQTEAAQKIAVKHMNGLIVFASLGLSILPKDYDAERFSPELSVPFVIKNMSSKDISGVKGMIILQDIFGNPLKKLGLTTDETIKAGQSATMPSYVWKLNQFEDDDNRLQGMDLKKVKVVFVPEMIVFSDGTNEKAPGDAD